MKTKRKAAKGGNQPAADVSAVPKPLTVVQQLVCDEVSELLLSGGRHEDLDALLKVSMESAMWRFLDGCKHLSDAEKRADLAKLVDRDMAEYRASILNEWKHAQGTPAQPERKTAVVDRIKSRIMENLRAAFANFSEGCTPEEGRFMIDVFEDWENYSLTRLTVRPCLVVAESFARQLHAEVGYIEVPEQHREAVEAYLKCLKKIEQAA